MILIFITALILGMSWLCALPLKLTSASVGLHLFCLRSLPSGVENLPALEALVCGKNMQDLELKQLLLQSSLIHIFIISGSHFLFLHKILTTLVRSRTLALLPLAIYAVMTLCQPPGVRSLIFIFCLEIARKQKLFLSSAILLLWSSLFSLALFPDWIHSRSFLMSLMAALILAVVAESWPAPVAGEDPQDYEIAKLFVSQIFLYLGMTVCLWGFSQLHPLSILFNLLIGPLIGGVLFPLSLAVVLCPRLAFLFDAAMRALTWCLQKSSEVLTGQVMSSPLSVGVQWVVFLILLWTSSIYFVQKKRKKAHEF